MAKRPSKKNPRKSKPADAAGPRSSPKPRKTTSEPAKSVKKGSPKKDQASHLDELRVKIDRVDARLIKLLNERADLVVDIGKTKQSTKTPIYAPHRESQVLQRVLDANRGPLPGRTIEGIYRELMSGSFALEQPLRIGYLGPQGSYSHMAATSHFGSSVAFEDLHEIRGVFTEVQRGHVDYGLAPIENSTGGGVVESLDALLATAGEVFVYAEVQLAVHHALLANCQPKAVRRIHAKPEAAAQCRTWLATQYPHADIVPAPSSSRAVMTAAEEHKVAQSIAAEPGSAAIGSTLAGELYGLRTLFARIEDNPNNVTRFFVLSKQQALPCGDDKTSIMFKTVDKPGALVAVLNVFASAGVNLTHIDKRPSGRTNWAYTFFLDAQGHRDDAAMIEAIEGSQAHCKELVILGSYPRSRRIL